ncbi:MAG: hypothetical protein LBG80_17745 [Bacteroidales bacterium]|jgi:acetyltransferase-like isoleucine patch superfamily enzyme|nr:hypothetical protein [Bacteroidales bacterium]
MRNVLSTILWKHLFGKCGNGTKVYHGFHCRWPGNIFLENNVLIQFYCGFSTEIRNAKLVILDKVHINSGCQIDYSGNLEIRSGVTISKDTYIITHSHGYDPRNQPIGKPLLIEENVWIGANVIILDSVSYIGKNSIIGAGSVVTRDIEDNVIVAGNPAKFIRNR